MRKGTHVEKDGVRKKVSWRQRAKLRRTHKAAATGAWFAPTRLKTGDWLGKMLPENHSKTGPSKHPLPYLSPAWVPSASL